MDHDLAKRRRRRTKVTFARLAEEAGVGMATVDRVLNARGSVSPATARKVIEAARRLDYDRRLPSPWVGGVRLNVVLRRRQDHFYRRLADGFRSVAATLDRSVTVEVNFVSGNEERALERHLVDDAERYQGYAIVGRDTAVVNALVERVSRRGTPLVTLVSDLPDSGRTDFIGIDNFSAGRTAAYFLLRLAATRGPAIVITLDRRFQVQYDRIDGFTAVVDEDTRTITGAIPVEVPADPDRAGAMLAEVIATSGPVSAVYCPGGDLVTAIGAVEAAGQAGRCPVVGHELTPATRALLQQRRLAFVIDQNPEEQARRAVRSLLGQLGLAAPATPDQPVPFAIYSPENLPPAR
ncbi:MAG: LacI family DNA-binding transcriptional regulator [Rhizobiaceae bacterium]|nr:LacI family DNA-binding transcriptional regulator [Rhizobiaceae bacterium]